MEIAKCLHHRELAFLTAKGEEKRLNVRYLYGASYDIFQKHIQALNFLDKNINMYRSVATLKPNAIPVAPYNLIRRLEDMEYQELNQNYEQYVEDYDFLLDFDGKEYTQPNKMYFDAKNIKKIFDDFSLPYGVWNSSLKGIHFWIDGRYFPKETEDWLKKRCALFQSIANNIKGIYAIDGLDTGIFDMKRLCKAPYSFISDGSICLPMDDKQFEEFFASPERVAGYRQVMAKVFIKNRGLLVRNLHLSEEQLKKNCERFVKEFQ
jgi:hypothetical protein